MTTKSYSTVEDISPFVQDNLSKSYLSWSDTALRQELDDEGTKVWGVLLGLGTLYSIWTIHANTLHYFQYPKSIRTETM